jgi:AbrB family looped-hinge helix DNA binding protein
MSTSTTSAKGQVTIPVAIRRKLGLEPGSAVRFVERDNEVVLERVDTNLGTICGLVVAPRSLSLEEMDRAVAEAVVQRHARR